MRKINSTNTINEKQILDSCGMAYTLCDRRQMETCDLMPA